MDNVRHRYLEEEEEKEKEEIASINGGRESALFLFGEKTFLSPSLLFIQGCDFVFFSSRQEMIVKTRWKGFLLLLLPLHRHAITSAESTAGQSLIIFDDIDSPLTTNSFF